MIECTRKLSGGLLLAFAVAILALVTVHADSGPTSAWTTDTFLDFVSDSTMTGVDAWSVPGTLRLDREWWPNVPVNDQTVQDKFSPRLSFLLRDAGGTAEPYFLAVWADEQSSDHYPDILFATSADGGRSWSADVKVADACDPSAPPYPDCPALYTPDIAARSTDETLWVVWHQDESQTTGDEGNILYASSNDLGATWSAAGTVYGGTGKQVLPRIASDASSGYLYAIWEDERGDDGDIYIARYNPDADTAWSAPIQINDDSSGNEQSRPALAVDGNGNVYAVWEDTRNDEDGRDTEIYFSRWLGGSQWSAAGWSANTRLSDPTMDWATEPDIAASPAGTVFAAWVERVPTGPGTYDFQVVVARSEDSGTSWDRSVVHRLLEASAANAFYASPALRADSSGQVYVAWLHSPDSQAATANILFSLSPDEGVHWTTPRVLSRPPSTVDVDTVPALALGSEGEVVVAWQDFRLGSSTQIYATGYPADRYTRIGTYTRTFDTTEPASWGSITWTATSAANTNIKLATRVLTDSGWTEWHTHATSGEDISHPPSRVIQYRVSFTSDGANTPVLDEVVISYEQQHHIYLPVALKGS